MTGTLGLFSLVDLFQLLSASARTGRLAVEHPRGAARVYFDRGRVVHAEFTDLVGEEAVYALFADERGAFEFTVGLPASRTTVATATENLMLEAIRRLDEGRRDDSEAIAAEAVPDFAADDAAAGHLTLQGHEVSVLRYVDGQRTVLQIAAAAAVDLDTVRGVVDRLVRVGALRLRARRPRTARLVARLASRRVDEGAAGIDPNILASWEKVLGYPPERVACRRDDGRVSAFAIQPFERAGPYIVFSRDTLMRADLAVNEVLLVKPVPRREDA